MLKLKSQKGFTIVELLIVIVVIGILAALVLNTFAGVQKRARDTERQTDTTALATQLEVYYNDKGGYPQFSQINDADKAKDAFKGIDAGALGAPKDDFSLQGSIATAADQYGYVTTGCSVAVTDDDKCTGFTLSYFKEDGGVTKKESLNKPSTP